MVRFTLRIPDDLYEQVAESAATSRRSLNAQVLWLLEQALQPAQEAERGE
ncbi:Arc family DNA-binding protein [Nonomuraea sp. NPDC004580]